MKELRRKVLMVGRIFQQKEVFKLILRAAQALQKHASTEMYFLQQKTLQKMRTSHPKYTCFKFEAEEHRKVIDFVITIGGDGTILYAAKEFMDDPPLMVTFQSGTLGFMCRFNEQQIEEIMEELCKNKENQKDGNYKQEKVIRIEAVTKEARKLCVNEVHISKIKHQRVVLSIYVNGLLVTESAGDGLLISTPTGSTAYSLSAGGPIIENGVQSILLVPIAPNSLSFRPICLKADSEIKIAVAHNSRSGALMTFDGQTHLQLNIGESVIIRRAKSDLRFLQPKVGRQKIEQWMQRLIMFLGWNQKYVVPVCQVQQQDQKIFPKHEQQNTFLKPEAI